jgi:hypothetical protein
MQANTVETPTPLAVLPPAITGPARELFWAQAGKQDLGPNLLGHRS